MTSSIDSLGTPVVVVDVSRMRRNIQRMQSQANRQEVRLRLHAKTTNCKQV